MKISTKYRVTAIKVEKFKTADGLNISNSKTILDLLRLVVRHGAVCSFR